MQKILICICLLFSIAASAQNTIDTTQAAKSNYLKIFLSGDIYWSDYIRQHITFVNYVRDRFEADVHLLITSQTAGSGGTGYTLFYYGQQSFKGKDDTLKYFSGTTSTEDETREGLTRQIKMGLMRYIASLPEANQVEISFAEKTKEDQTTDPVDKWRNWVFSVSTNAYLNGEKSYQYLQVSGGISASKITDKWKIKTAVGASFHKTHYVLDTSSYDSKSDSRGASLLVVKSLSSHWSIGGNSGVSHSLYSNNKLRAYFGPAIEYDVFPYTASSSKILTFLYEVKPSYNWYIDTTFFNKTEEFLMSERLEASFTVVQKWGSVNTGIGGSHFFHDFTANEFYISSTIQWRIVQGLSCNVSGYFSVIHDQLSLPKGGATTEEVLTQQKQIATSYSYFASFGISYTFGSIFNSVVNPRFDSNDGSFYY